MTITFPIRERYTDKTESVPGTKFTNNTFQELQQRNEEFSNFSLAHLFSVYGFLSAPIIEKPSVRRLTLKRNTSALTRYASETLGMFELPDDISIDFSELTSGVAVDRYDYLYLELYRYNNDSLDSGPNGDLQGKIGYRLNIYEDNASPTTATEPDVTTSARQESKEEGRIIIPLRSVHRYQTTEEDETDITTGTDISVNAVANIPGTSNLSIPDLTIETLTVSGTNFGIDDAGNADFLSLFVNESAYGIDSDGDGNFNSLTSNALTVDFMDINGATIQFKGVNNTKGLALGTGATVKHSLYMYDGASDEFIIKCENSGVEHYEQSNDGQLTLRTGNGQDLTIDSAADILLNAGSDADVKVNLDGTGNFYIVGDTDNPLQPFFDAAEGQNIVNYWRVNESIVARMQYAASAFTMQNDSNDNLINLNNDGSIDINPTNAGDVTINGYNTSDIFLKGATCTYQNTGSTAEFAIQGNSSASARMKLKQGTTDKVQLYWDDSNNRFDIQNLVNNNYLRLNNNGGIAGVSTNSQSIGFNSADAFNIVAAGNITIDGNTGYTGNVTTSGGTLQIHKGAIVGVS
jgi:hypothetical protein